MLYLKATNLLSAAALTSTVFGAVNQVFTGKATPVDPKHGAAAVDKYNLYKGDGSGAAGWPEMDKWISFDAMWEGALPQMKKSCSNLYTADKAVPDSSDAELAVLNKAILDEAATAQLDARFVLAILLQESHGCIRVATTVSPGTPAVRNPGLFQDHDGASSCNAIGDTDAAVALLKGKPGVGASSFLSPCPDDIIKGMVAEGVSGTAAGDGLAAVANQALSPAAAHARRVRRDLSGSFVQDGLVISWKAVNASIPTTMVTATRTLTITSTAISTPPATSSLPASSAPAASATSSAPVAPPASSAAPAPSAASGSSTGTAQIYYRAARIYNSGAMHEDLGDGITATNCYAADIANRLTGWTGKDDKGSCSMCDLDFKAGKTQGVRPWGLCAGI